MVDRMRSSRLIRRALALIAALPLALSVPTGAEAAPSIPAECLEYTGNQFAELFDTAQLPNLRELDPLPAITGDATRDAAIRDAAEERGYELRPVPSEPLPWVDGFQLQAEAVAAWESLQSASGDAGVPLLIVSGYRSVDDQRVTFFDRVARYGSVEAALAWVAPPGYSKHQTGYAVDITQSGWDRTGFVGSPAFAWLTADNYAVAKAHGFIPSYPPDADCQGPNPEPWEFTYVGVGQAACGGLNIGIPPRIQAEGTDGSLDDLRVCPNQPLARGAMSDFLSNALRLGPSAGDTFVDDDGHWYEDGVEALAGAGITEGCNPPVNDRFCPDRLVTRGSVAAFLVRALGLPDAAGDAFTDDDGSVFEDEIEALAAAGITEGCTPARDLYCPDEPVTRNQMADLLERALGITIEGPGTFVDDESSPFEEDIEWLAAEGITTGCNPPDNDHFCPEEPVTRAQMASFLDRALDLPKADGDRFTDDDNSTHEAAIDRLAAAGITTGCGTGQFCPDEPVTRAQMASFLDRALDLPKADGDRFTDDDNSTHEAAIDRLAAAGVTGGCNAGGTLYCPDDPVTRGQMAAFLHRAAQFG